MEYRSMNIRQFMDDLRRHPMLAEIPFETVIAYVVDFFQLVGLETTSTEKTEIIKIDKYRAKLPSDYLDVIQVRTTNNPPIYYRYATDTFHYSDNKYFASPYTYKINNDVIFTSEESGEIEIAYTAMDVDDCGFPLIPDDSKYTRALKAYIKLQWFGILFDLGKIPQQPLDKADQEYCWAVGALESSGHRISLDKAESLLNMARNIFNPQNSHHRGYSSTGDRDVLKVK